MMVQKSVRVTLRDVRQRFGPMTPVGKLEVVLAASQVSREPSIVRGENFVIKADAAGRWWDVSYQVEE